MHVVALHSTKSLNFIFPSKYPIPKSLKVSYWLSKLFCREKNIFINTYVNTNSTSPFNVFSHTSTTRTKKKNLCYSRHLSGTRRSFLEPQEIKLSHNFNGLRVDYLFLDLFTLGDLLKNLVMLFSSSGG